MTEALRVCGSSLPDGRDVELWIRDGRFHLDGPSDARELAPPGGFLLSGRHDLDAGEA